MQPLVDKNTNTRRLHFFIGSGEFSEKEIDKLRTK